MKLGDFSTTPRVIPITLLAIVIGGLSAFVALALLWLIGLFTNLFFFQRWSTALIAPAGNHLGPLVILVPVLGAVAIGFMARYGSERIRGHGIPEAIESILIGGSRIQPRVAFLKPVSSALSIGTGGPFGAEGPIIMTGGAFGSMVAQFFRLTAAERKTLLVAGAAGGMAATFAVPVASTLLGVELLLFEWKPRSLIPVAMASATAALLRPYLIGPGPMFPMAAQAAAIGPVVLLGCILAGLLAGALSSVVTMAVYAAEDAFRLLPLHWMWWPAIGGAVVGIGGLVFPQALGVGYDVIAALLRGDVVRNVIVGILVVKSIIWAVSLGSGTSGGVLAPLLMMGGALGGLEAGFLPAQAAGFWPLVSMSAVLGGTMRIPLTAVVFSVELTHNLNMMLPLLVSTVVAHGFTVLAMRRSILTEKVARRGYHLTCEYAIDPLEVLFVREVMRTNLVVLPPEIEAGKGAAAALAGGAGWQRVYPVADAGRRLLGVLNRRELERLAGEPGPRRMVEAARLARAVAYPDEPLSVVVYRMAGTGVTSLPVVERTDPHKLAGMVALDDLLKARARHLEQERRRERALHIRFRRPRRQPRELSITR